MTETRSPLLAALIVGSMLCTAAVGFAAEGKWVRKADMPTPRFGSSIAEIDGKLFVIGGSQGDRRLATVEVYDPATDTWTPRAAMPAARKNTAAAVVNGIIYVFGGTRLTAQGSLRTTEAYDPTTDTWTKKKDMPTARSGQAALPFQGKIYVIGGWGVNDAHESAVEVYDPVTDTWEDKAPLPLASNGFGFAGLNGKIYVFGGASDERMLSDTREYDPVTDSWTTKAAMPNARLSPSASVLDGKLYVLGGNLNLPDNYPVTGQVNVYDPATDAWTAGETMPTARGGLASATVNGKIYAIGGHTGLSWEEDAGTIYATVEEFSLPATPAPPLTIQRSVLLSWKQSATDYVVEGASSAEGPWTKLAEFESHMLGDEVHVTVIQKSEVQFFRLSVIP